MREEVRNLERLEHMAEAIDVLIKYQRDIHWRRLRPTLSYISVW